MISPDTMFDVQVKHIHEYKNQLINNLGFIYQYNKMKEMTPEERREKCVPLVCIFGGKEIPTYEKQKRIMKLITNVGVTINHDTEIGVLLMVSSICFYDMSA